MKQSNQPLMLFAKIIFWFVALNALAGAGALILLPTQTDTFFFWPIKPPINAALFGALYLGGGLAVGYLTCRGVWEPCRFLIPVLVSAGVFISVTTLIHLDKFTPGFKLWYWLIIYVGAPLLALGIYLQQERQGANWKVNEPITPAVLRIALVVGSLLVVLGVLLIYSPGIVVAQWPWQTSPLMVRIFASWFSAFGVGLIWFWVDRDWQRVQYVASLMIAAAIFDLAMIVVHRSELNGVGLNLWIYCLHLAAFGVLGLFMHWQQRAAARKLA